jgi:hypothetical protein
VAPRFENEALKRFLMLSIKDVTEYSWIWPRASCRAGTFAYAHGSAVEMIIP